MKDFEKLGVFYLGKSYDLESKKLADDPLLYDSKDLVTHALCVGMTGSGKTGLCIDLIEEAAIDGVPVIAIDPKGDLANLMLTFPALDASAFEPWVSEDEARRAGQTKADFAAAEAAKWKKGLASWGEDEARIQRLREAAEVAIYTPGSSTGLPVSVLRSFDPPTFDDPELVQQRVLTTVSGLLALAGVDADPVKSREHLLLSAIVSAAWAAGESLDLAALVQRVQQPPMARIGVIDTDSFFPPKDRFALAMSINALLASPSFASWLEGEPLDVGGFLRTPAGKPRIAIFSIAHLDDAQRMFFVSLLLNATIAWMRTQQGTSSLRAMLYMDEIFGYFPPVANPPSKPPILTLLKQARAFGLGIVLATQNPVDLDYKGLANIGTWWLGRLQTERDKARVLDGLEGASAISAFNRSAVDRMLSGLSARTFLMRNVHENDLTVFQSRWSLSYLRGPLGRDEIRTLMAGAAPASRLAAASTAAAGRATGSSTASGALSAAAPSAAHASRGGGRPLVPPDVPQFFAPATDGAACAPVIYGAVDLRFVDAKLGIDVSDTRSYTTPVSDAAIPVEWTAATVCDVTPDELIREPDAAVTFADLPVAATKARNYDAWAKQLATYASTTESIQLFVSRSSGERSNPGESEREFRARLQQVARESRDAAVEALRRKYATQQTRLAERLQRAQQANEREASQATAAKLQTAISVGATLMTALLGRKSVSMSTIGRATTAARGAGRVLKESQDVQRSADTVAAVQAEQQALEQQIQDETAALQSASDPLTEALDRVTVKPKKGNVTVKICALVWMP